LGNSPLADSLFFEFLPIFGLSPHQPRNFHSYYEVSIYRSKISRVGPVNGTASVGYLFLYRPSSYWVDTITILKLLPAALSKYIFVVVVMSIVSLVLLGCSDNDPLETTVPTLEEAATALPTGTATLEPTETPQSGLVVLLAPPGARADLADILQGILTDLAAQADLRFQVRQSLAQAEMENVQVVVVLSPDPGVTALAESAPDTQFLAVGIPGLEPTPNLSVVESAGGRPDMLGFLAGYTAAAITPDWRVAVVAEDGTPSGSSYRLGFTNGFFYFCGLCRPVYPPFPTSGYPLYVELPATAGPADWDSTIAHFNAWQAETVFVDPNVAAPEFLDTLAQAGFNLILVGPPSAGLNEHWVASIGALDPIQSVRELLPGLLNGGGGVIVELPLGFTGVNPDLFSPGRQRLTETMLADLLAGYIDTGVDPATGEAR